MELFVTPGQVIYPGRRASSSVIHTYHSKYGFSGLAERLLRISAAQRGRDLRSVAIIELAGVARSNSRNGHPVHSESGLIRPGARQMLLGTQCRALYFSVR